MYSGEWENKHVNNSSTMYVLCYNESITNKIQPLRQEVITSVEGFTTELSFELNLQGETVDKVASGLLPQQQGAFSPASPGYPDCTVAALHSSLYIFCRLSHLLED